MGKTLPPSESILFEALEYIGIISLGVSSACIYGIVNDQITARICFEYFSEGFHKNNLRGSPIEKFLKQYPRNPTVWALTWGIIASWVVGLVLGVAMAIFSRAGPWPKLPTVNLIVPAAICILSIGVTVFIITALHCLFGAKIPANEIATRLRGYGYHIANYSPATHEQMGRNYLLCLYIHRWDYIIGIIYGLVLLIWPIYKRYRLSQPGGKS